MSEADFLEGIRFLEQKITELTFHYALDSYKAPTLNAPSLVEEAVEVWNYLSQQEDAGPRMVHLLDEIRFSLTGNEIAKTLLPQPFTDYLALDLQNPCETSTKLKMLSRHLDPYAYFMTVKSLLVEAVPTNKKGRISRLAAELVSTLVNIGMSPSYIHSTTKTFWPNRRSRESRLAVNLKIYLDSLDPVSHTFKVCTKIVFNTDIDLAHHSELFGVDFPTELPAEFLRYALDHEVKNLTGDEVLVVISDIQAIDAHKAMSDARERIARLFDTVKLFDHRVDYQICSAALIHQCCIDDIYQSQHDRNRMHFVSRPFPQEGTDKLAALFSGIKLERPDELSRFFRAIDLHGVSVSSNILENQFLNMWICFETTARTRPSKTIIEDVVSNVVPVIMLNYFGRLLTDICFALERAANRPFEKAMVAVNCSTDASRQEKILRLILDEENKHTLMELGGELHGFPLLRNRLANLQKNMKSGRARASFLERHEKLVTWQLHRIYRTRNSIVHSGVTPTFTSSLLENAHDFFDQTFLTICDWVAGQNGLSSFEQCFEYARMEHKNYLTSVSSDSVGLEQLVRPRRLL